jgi:hypothetical protein
MVTMTSQWFALQVPFPGSWRLRKIGAMERHGDPTHSVHAQEPSTRQEQQGLLSLWCLCHVGSSCPQGTKCPRKPLTSQRGQTLVLLRPNPILRPRVVKAAASSGSPATALWSQLKSYHFPVSGVIPRPLQWEDTETSKPGTPGASQNKTGLSNMVGTKWSVLLWAVKSSTYSGSPLHSSYLRSAFLIG